jgi:hypothetical protein
LENAQERHTETALLAMMAAASVADVTVISSISRMSSSPVQRPQNHHRLLPGAERRATLRCARLRAQRVTQLFNA